MFGKMSGVILGLDIAQGQDRGVVMVSAPGKPPGWIAKQSGAPMTPDEAVGLVAARANAGTGPRPVAREMQTLHVRPKSRPSLDPQPSDYPPAATLDMATELREFLTLSKAYSPLKTEMKRRGFIRSTTDDTTGLWAGDIITEEGQTFLAEEG